jgi:hypothetical protein
MRKKLCYDVGVPVWFLFVGATASVYPPASPAAGVVAFVVALVIVPLVTLGADVFCERRFGRRAGNPSRG